MEPTILLTDIILRWPAVYEKATVMFGELKPRYSVSFEADEELIERLAAFGIAPKFNERQNGFFFHARAGVAPTVTPKGGDFDALMRATQIAAARSIPLDRLLRDLPCNLRVTFFDYAYQGHKGRGMAITEVIADEAAMLRIATGLTED